MVCKQRNKTSRLIFVLADLRQEKLKAAPALKSTLAFPDVMNRNWTRKQGLNAEG
jgi:hypothetical protein